MFCRSFIFQGAETQDVLQSKIYIVNRRVRTARDCFWNIIYFFQRDPNWAKSIFNAK